MTILVAPDKFRGSLTAPAAAAAIARGLRSALPAATVLERPLGDGGEGTLDLLRDRLGLDTKRLTVTGPLRRPVEATYLLGRGRAVVELASASGLHLVPPARRNPRNTTTIGTGELLEDALSRGATDITLLLGGSATSDAGVGLAGALGYRFFGERGTDFIPTADTLGYVTRIDESAVNPLLAEANFTVVCDVNNPLLGPRGATFTYAPQKGATPEDLPELEGHQTAFARTLTDHFGRDLTATPGAGAAGGAAFGALHFLGARLGPGSETVMDLLGLNERLRRADLVVTGEGRVDATSGCGKVVGVLAARSRRLRPGVPVVALCGQSTLADPSALGLDRLLAILPGRTADEADAHLRAADHLRDLAYALGHNLPNV